MADDNAARECAGVTVDAARLACYDALFRSDQRAAPTATPPAASFGMTDRLRMEAAHQPHPGDLPKRVTAKVVAASALPGERYRLELDNGQVWETREGSWNTSFTAGQDIQIDRGISNAYRIAVAGEGRFLAAKRIK